MNAVLPSPGSKGPRGGPASIGATGALLTTRLLYSMKRHGLANGIVILHIGGDQGIALALEVLNP